MILFVESRSDLGVPGVDEFSGPWWSETQIGRGDVKGRNVPGFPRVPEPPSPTYNIHYRISVLTVMLPMITNPSTTLHPET